MRDGDVTKYDLKHLSERDICTKVILPSLISSGWDQIYIREEVNLTAGRIVVRGNMALRIKNPDAKGGPKRADYVLYDDTHIPLAVIEAKKNTLPLGEGMQQALAYAEMLDSPFAFSSNGDGFLFHDRTGLSQPTEQVLDLDDFPSPEELWRKYRSWKNIDDEEPVRLMRSPYFSDSSGREPRYYQKVAVNRTVEAIAMGRKRLLLVMATGTGKTYTAFQIIWRLWKAKSKKRILFLADRNILIDQTMTQDFAPFGEAMHKIGNRTVKRNYEIYLSLYQAVTGTGEEKQIFKQFPRDFFDLVVVDECHRGSAAEDSAWREILSYFDAATHIGLTATPKETAEISNITYFGEPIYTYSLRQGIEDGFLAPYKVIRIVADVDALGYVPEAGTTDRYGREVERRHYDTKDFDRTLVLDERTRLVARKVWEYLSATDPMAKTIVFCDDQEHAERMRQELVKLIPEAATNRKYLMRITGDDAEGKAQLSYFIDNDEPYPVIATTSKLLSTGVDAKTCKLIVIDQTINSMTEFKQIIGRGTRIREDYQKLFFTIMDFKGATRLFADPAFDGEPVVVYEPKSGESAVPPDDYEEPSYEDRIEDFDEIRDGPRKYYLPDVAVSLAAERSQYLDADGRLISEDYRVYLKDEIKRSLRERFGSLQDFLNKWNAAERKRVILEELSGFGVSMDVLVQAVPDGKEYDPFDLIAHIAFDQKPMTRRERANGVKKRNYFGKYGDKARLVLDALLEKYAGNGISEIENPTILELPPFDSLGSRTEIRRSFFGGTERFSDALTELERELYEQKLG